MNGIDVSGLKRVKDNSNIFMNIGEIENIQVQTFLKRMAEVEKWLYLNSNNKIQYSFYLDNKLERKPIEYEKIKNKPLRDCHWEIEDNIPYCELVVWEEDFKEV